MLTLVYWNQHCYTISNAEFTTQKLVFTYFKIENRLGIFKIFILGEYQFWKISVVKLRKHHSQIFWSWLQTTSSFLICHLQRFNFSHLMWILECVCVWVCQHLLQNYCWLQPWSSLKYFFFFQKLGKYTYN